MNLCARYIPPAAETFAYCLMRNDFHLMVRITDDFGSNCPNTVLPVGTQVRLDVDTTTLEMLEPCVE